jgi:hypothetical protein
MKRTRRDLRPLTALRSQELRSITGGGDVPNLAAIIAGAIGANAPRPPQPGVVPLPGETPIPGL